MWTKRHRVTLENAELRSFVRNFVRSHRTKKMFFLTYSIKRVDESKLESGNPNLKSDFQNFQLFLFLSARKCFLEYRKSYVK